MGVSQVVEPHSVQANFVGDAAKSLGLGIRPYRPAIRMLKPGSRAGIVIKNTGLSNTDNASVSLRKLLLESCNLHTILDCPSGTFLGAGVKTVVLLFEKGAPTQRTWYYQLVPGRNMGKTNPLNDADLAEFVALQKDFADSPKAWSVDASTVDPTTFDLSVKNPDCGDEVVHLSPPELINEISTLDANLAAVLEKGLVEQVSLLWRHRGRHLTVGLVVRNPVQ